MGARSARSCSYILPGMLLLRAFCCSYTHVCVGTWRQEKKNASDRYYHPSVCPSVPASPSVCPSVCHVCDMCVTLRSDMISACPSAMCVVCMRRVCLQKCTGKSERARFHAFTHANPSCGRATPYIRPTVSGRASMARFQCNCEKTQRWINEVKRKRRGRAQLPIM